MKERGRELKEEEGLKRGMEKGKKLYGNVLRFTLLLLIINVVPTGHNYSDS